MNPFADLFAPTEHVLLDNAVEGPTPRPVAEALRAFAARLATVPSWIRDRDELPARVATAVARLFDVPSEWVSLTTSTTEGISLIARSVSLDPGTHVVIPHNEYPATVVPWLVQELAGCARVRRVACDAFEGPSTRDLVAAVAEAGTSAVSISAIGWQGVRHDLPAIARAAGSALFVIDASQATGAIRIDGRHLRGACISTTFSKWAFGPEGVGAVVIPDTVRARMSRPVEIVELALESPLAFSHRLPAVFHAGSPAPIALAGARAALELVEQLGIETIGAHGAALAATARNRLAELGWWVAPTSSAIVCFRPPRTIDLEALLRHLRQAGIFLSVREGALRASFHIHNDVTHIDRMCAALVGAVS